MTLRFGAARRVARRIVDRRSPRIRLLVARVMARMRLDSGSIQRLAHQFVAEDRYAGAAACWRRMYRLVPYDDVVLAGCLRSSLEAGMPEAAARRFREANAQAGMPPALVVWLSGELLWRDGPQLAGQVIATWLESVQGDGRVAPLSPSLVSASITVDLPELADWLASATADSGDRRVAMARLCFTVDEMSIAARLYRRAGHEQLTWLDRLAMYHGEAFQTSGGVTPPDRAELQALTEAAADDADALFALAGVALVTGDKTLARNALKQALDTRYAGLPSLASVQADAEAMLTVLDQLRTRSLHLPDRVLERVTTVDEPVRKLFVCGFGWTGSGAVYDAVRGHSGVCEFAGAGADARISADSDTEATFIQSWAGLGRLWAGLRASEPLTWTLLWDLFRCHVVGLCPIGYSTYKAACATNNQILRHGAAYTDCFRQLFDGLAGQLEKPARGGLHTLLTRATEGLCRMLLDSNDADMVLFNNAVFGRDMVMLEIFAGHRAAIVFRDPRDVFVDRRRQDRNHWRGPAQMTDFYRRGMLHYLSYRGLTDAATTAPLREVPFERFVTDDDFRERVCQWLLADASVGSDTPYFDSAVSCGNIGIHGDALSDTDKRTLEAAMDTYRHMLNRTAASWDAT